MSDWLSPTLAPLTLAATPLATALGVLAHGIFSPGSRVWGPVVSRARPATPAVALTFDDGPTPGCTDRVLDVLGELGVKAAFFVIGRSAARHPDLVRRIHADGHVVGNHTWDHAYLGTLRFTPYWVEQLSRTDRVIEQAIGRRPAYMRPPLGLKHLHAMTAARRLGHTIVNWSLRGRDASRHPAEAVLGRLVGPAEAGDIILLHDGLEPRALRTDAANTCRALRPLVRRLGDKGLECVRLDQLIGIAPYAPESSPRVGSAPAIPAADAVVPGGLVPGGLAPGGLGQAGPAPGGRSLPALASPMMAPTPVWGRAS